MVEDHTETRKSKELIIIGVIAVGLPLLIVLCETGWLSAYFRDHPLSVWTFTKPIRFIGYASAALLSYKCFKATRVPFFQWIIAVCVLEVLLQPILGRAMLYLHGLFLPFHSPLWTTFVVARAVVTAAISILTPVLFILAIYNFPHYVRWTSVLRPPWLLAIGLYVLLFGAVNGVGVQDRWDVLSFYVFIFVPAAIYFSGALRSYRRFKAEALPLFFYLAVVLLLPVVSFVASFITMTLYVVTGHPPIWDPTYYVATITLTLRPVILAYGIYTFGNTPQSRLDVDT